jgi:hypothetical protein
MKLKKYKHGGASKKQSNSYLKGGQVKLDKNNDGELTEEDFELLRKQKTNMKTKKKSLYAKYGALVKAMKKYEDGGKTKKSKGEIRVQDLPTSEAKKIGLGLRNRDSFLGRGEYEDFYNMNLYSATPDEALLFFRVDEAKRLLKQKEGVDIGAEVKPERVLSMAKTKGLLQDANSSAKKMFEDWTDDRDKNPDNYRASYAGVGGATRRKDAEGNPIMLD